MTDDEIALFLQQHTLFFEISSNIIFVVFHAAFVFYQLNCQRSDSIVKNQDLIFLFPFKFYVHFCYC